MSYLYRPWRIGFLSLIVVAFSVAGTGWVLYTRAGDGNPKAGERSATVVSHSGGSVVCFGHVDVEPGITALYPVKPGRVIEVLVHEDDSIKVGTVLFRLDERQAKFLVRRAQEDLKESELQLADARKLPQQQDLKLAQHRHGILAKQHRLPSARHLLEH